MPYSEALKAAFRDTRGYEPDRQSFFLGVFALAYQVRPEELAQIRLFYPQNTDVGYQYANLEEQIEEELETAAGTEQAEESMRTVINGYSNQIENLAKLIDPESGFELLAFFKEIFEQRMKELAANTA